MDESLRSLVFDPKDSIGWTVGPLEGLSCFLRCVEACLRFRGLDSTERALALLQPLDLTHRKITSSHFLGVKVNWVENSTIEDKRRILPQILGRSEPVIVMLDVYYWSGHSFHQKRHIRDHMVLLERLADGRLEYLDTDAKAEQGYRGFTNWDDETLGAISRYATLSIRKENLPDQKILSDWIFSSLISPHQEAFKKDIEEFAAFALKWREKGLDDSVARALHVKCLGDFQPMLAVYAECLLQQSDPKFSRLCREFQRAAKKSWQVGLSLLKEHVGKPHSYRLSLILFESFVESLKTLEKEINKIETSVSFSSKLPEFFSNATSVRGSDLFEFSDRLNGLAKFCYGSWNETSHP